MKQFLFSVALILGFCSVNAQTWQKVAGRWQYTFIRSDSTLTPPADTLKSAPNGSLAIKNSMAYFKDNAGVWRPFSVTLNDEWVSTLDFGAKPNDTAKDYSDNINAALSSGARCVMIPAGVYKIKKPLLINSNTVIFGYGAEIKRDSAIDNIVKNNADGVTGGYEATQNIRFYGVQFNGARENFAGNCTIVAIGHANNVVFQDCEFRGSGGAWHCLELNGVRDARVSGCYFHDASGAENLQLDLMNGSALFPWFGPYDNTWCTNITINGNVFANGTGSALGSHSGADPWEHNNIVISNNVVRNMAGDAFNMLGYRNLTITGNTIDSCNLAINQYRTGAHRMVENWVISNNTIKRCLNNGLNLFNIKGLVISGNVIDTTRYWGISVQTSRSVEITNNVLKNVCRDLTGNYGAIEINADTNVIVRNNVCLKDTAGYKLGTYTLKATGIVGGFFDGNTFFTPATATGFTQFTGSNLKVGVNVINDATTPAITAITADYTYKPTDGVISVNTTSGNVNVTVNPSVFNTGGLTIKKTSSDANTVTVTASSGQINGASSVTIAAQDQAVLIRSDFANLDGVVTSSVRASDGVAVENGVVKLGQLPGAVGDPAALSLNREIPLNTHTLNFKGGAVGFNNSSPVYNADINGQLGVTQNLSYPFYGYVGGASASINLVHGNGSYGLAITRAGTSLNGANLALFRTWGSDASVRATVPAGNMVGRISFQSVASDNVNVGIGSSIIAWSATTSLTSGVQHYLSFVTTNDAGGQSDVKAVLSPHFNLSLMDNNGVFNTGTGEVDGSKLYLNKYVTGSDSYSLFNSFVNWNTTGTPTALKMNIADTASNAASLIFDYSVNSSSRFKMSKAGQLTLGGYGVGSFTGTPVSTLATASNGAVIEIPQKLRYAITATKTVTASDTITSAVGSGVGTLIVPANSLTAGKSYRVTIRGTVSTDASNPANFTYKVFLGSTELLSTGGAGVGASRTDVNYELKAEITCRSTGALGTFVSQGMFFKDDGPGAKAAVPTASFVDTTIANAFNVTVKMSDGSAGNNWYAYILILEEI